VVTTKSVERLADDLEVRTLSVVVEQEEAGMAGSAGATAADDDVDDEPYVFRHVSYSGWPDFGTSDDSAVLFKTMRLAREPSDETTARVGEGPVVVHCSAGVGRTGSWIAMDLKKTRKDPRSLSDLVRDLRARRPNMVTTFGQFEMIHRVLGLVTPDDEGNATTRALDREKAMLSLEEGVGGENAVFAAMTASAATAPGGGTMGAARDAPVVAEEDAVDDAEDAKRQSLDADDGTER